MHDNKYIAYFSGHEKTVTSLEMCPSNDRFLSASDDNTVRLWDLMSRNAIGKLDIPAPSLVAFDPTGLVFAVASRPTKTISLYDARSYLNGPFQTFSVDCGENVKWAKIEFSNNKKYLLLATNFYAHYVFDAFTGTVLKRLVGHEELMPRKTGNASPAAFSVDGNYVVGASKSHGVVIWDLEASKYPETKPSATLKSENNAQIVAFNPRLFLMASADRELTLWLPS